MNVSVRLFVGYFLMLGLAAWFVLNIFMHEAEPGIRQATEETLVDTAPVSYTHLDVYKRQPSASVAWPPRGASWCFRGLPRGRSCR